MTTPPPPPPGPGPTAPPPGEDPYQPWASPPQDPYQQPPQAYPQPPPYQTPSLAPYQVSGGGQPYSPYPPAYPGPPMSFGFDPMTGQPYSDRSKMVAGLLQLLPGCFLALGGIGRVYAGHTALGVVQIVLSAVAGVSLICWFLVFPFFLVFGMWLWAVIDGIVLLAGRPTDGLGRLLRP